MKFLAVAGCCLASLVLTYLDESTRPQFLRHYNCCNTITTIKLRWARQQKWLRKSEQGDKWNRCLIEGMIVLSETGARDEQTTPP